MSNLLWSQNDFFPLNVGNQWDYAYQSIEKEYIDIAFMDKVTIDSGNVRYEVIDSIKQASTIIWTVEEHYVIQRHIADYNFSNDTTDTTYSINGTISFQLYESLDSLHTLTSDSYYEVFTFPIKWENFSGMSSKIPITRFRKDSSVSIISEYNYIIASFSDSLVFHENKGLVYAQSIISKGPNVPYYYKWKATLSSSITDIKKDVRDIPKEFTLSQNYPNPFNPSTKIKFSIPAVIASEVRQSVNTTLRVYDILGREVATLLNKDLSAGSYEVTFDASDLPSGIYVYTLNSGKFNQSRKMLLLK